LERRGLIIGLLLGLVIGVASAFAGMQLAVSQPSQHTVFVEVQTTTSYFLTTSVNIIPAEQLILESYSWSTPMPGTLTGSLRNTGSTTIDMSAFYVFLGDVYVGHLGGTCTSTLYVGSNCNFQISVPGSLNPSPGTAYTFVLLQEGGRFSYSTVAGASE
jgi:hypothetical protein